MKMLSEKQLHNRLNKYYLENFGERDTDEWYGNLAPNIWKFERDGRTVHLICDLYTGKIKEN